ncbi:MAG: GNAT family N-acetyltransferase [Pirellulales bacterium]
MVRVQHADSNHAADAAECLSLLNYDGRRFFGEPVVAALIQRQVVYVAIAEELGAERVVAAMALEYDDQSYKILALASRKKGGGSALIRMAEAKCRAEGVPKLWCWSLARYDVSGFYKKQGFEERHLLRRQFLGEDCWFFGKVIDLSDASNLPADLNS